MADQKTMEELAKRLQDAERQRADANQQLADANQQLAVANQQLAVANQQLAVANQQRDAEQQQNRPTTLLEYIDACHNLVFSKFTVESDKSLTSKGSITNPRNKLCPTSLKPWPDFIEQQREVSGVLHTLFPAEHLFESRSFLRGLGNRVSQKPVANEKALEYFLHLSVEDPVRSILQQLKEVDQVRSIYDIGGGAVFENHFNAISDIAEEVVAGENSLPPQTPYYGHVSNQLRPDQICVYRSDDGLLTRQMIYVCEYKAPHKLTAPHLRVGLRPMDIYTEVVNRQTIPTSAYLNERFQYFAERLTCAAISQTYHYMIEGGLEYGLLTTGDAIVFLRVDWVDPGTLYYHLAEPQSEVSAHPNHLHSCTAVGQYLAFTLMALGQPGQRRGHSQKERYAATQGLKTWVEDFDSILQSIPASDRRAPSTSPGHRPTTYKLINRSPYPLRFPRPAARDDEPSSQLTTRDTPESSDDELCRPPDTPSPAQRRTASLPQGSRRSERIRAQRPDEAASRRDAAIQAQRPAEAAPRSAVLAVQYRRDAALAVQYCTQKCLLGLVRGMLLDSSCPNVALHSSPTSRSSSQWNTRHPVRHGKWLQLLQKQLKNSLDDGITPLYENGSRGALFQVTMLAYGYTFVAKGTVRAFVKDLEHEAAVYRRLEPLQGSSVPVFLGSIDLRPMNRIYYYDHRVYIIHMSFLSWAGYKLHQLDLADGTTQQLADKAMQSLRLMHQAGVAHKDVRSANMLYNPETDGVMIIDFDRSTLVQPPRSVLQEAVPNKRKRDFHQTAKISSAVQGSDDERRHAMDISDDLIMANTAFAELNWCKAI